MLLSRGGSEDPVGQFKNFTGGGEPKIDALLERRGLVTGGDASEAPAEIAPEHKPKS
jgi:hypothetical protein